MNHLTRIICAASLLIGTLDMTTAQATNIQRHRVSTHCAARSARAASICEVEHSQAVKWGARVADAAKGLSASTRGPCSDPWWRSFVRPSMDRAKIDRRVLWVVRCAFDRYAPGELGTALQVMNRESSGWPWAINPVAEGVCQAYGRLQALLALERARDVHDQRDVLLVRRATVTASNHEQLIRLETAARTSRSDVHAAQLTRSSFGSCGLFQHLARYWPGRVLAFLRRDWRPGVWPHVSVFDIRAQALVTARMVAQSGWGAW